MEPNSNTTAAIATTLRDAFVFEFIPDLQRRKLIEPLHDLFLYLYYIWIHDYKTRRKGELIKRILKAGLKTGIHELMRDETYDADKLLNKRSIESLRDDVLEIVR